MPRQFTEAEARAILKENGREPIEPLIYINVMTPIKQRVIACGHIIEQILSGTKRGRGCIECKYLRASKTRQQNAVAKIKIAVEKAGYTLVGHFYKKNNQGKNRLHLKLICNLGHQITIRSSNFQQGNRCKYCFSINQSTLRKQKSLPKAKRAVAEAGYTWVGHFYKKDSQGSDQLWLKLTCSLGHNITISWNRFQQGRRCKECRDNKKTEREVRWWLENEIFKGFKFPSVFVDFIRNPLTNRPLEIDCFCEPLLIAVEVMGSQHSEKDHFFNQKNSFKELQERDEFKKRVCLERGIKFVEVSHEANGYLRSFLHREFRLMNPKERVLEVERMITDGLNKSLNELGIMVRV